MTLIFRRSWRNAGNVGTNTRNGTRRDTFDPKFRTRISGNGTTLERRELAPYDVPIR